MSSILLIISALLPILTSTLQSYKAISPTTGNLITGIEAAIAAVVSEFSTAGSTATPSITATSLLTAIQAAVSVLQTQTTISPKDLIIIAAVDSAIQAGLAASQITSVNPSTLAPITPV